MKLSYRPEIDGLRAIAVGAVILYHSKINFLNSEIFQGGFIGVDIFFCNFRIFNYFDNFARIKNNKRFFL